MNGEEALISLVLLWESYELKPMSCTGIWKTVALNSYQVIEFSLIFLIFSDYY